MFDPYRKWLGILPKDQPPNHYRLLGVEAFEDDLDVIEGAADKQMGFVRQYQSGEHAADAARILNELAVARLCLMKPETKAAYDAQLRQLQTADGLFGEFVQLAERKPKQQPRVQRASNRRPSSGTPNLLIIATTIAVVLGLSLLFLFGNGKRSRTPLVQKPPEEVKTKPPATVVVSATTPAIQRPPVVPIQKPSPPQNAGVTILEAKCSAGNSWMDLTDRLQMGVQSGQSLAVFSTGMLGGDPAFGAVKQLKVRYRLNNQVQEQWYSENSVVLLGDFSATTATHPKGLQIQDAYFGGGVFGETTWVNVTERVQSHIENGSLNGSVRKLVEGTQQINVNGPKVLVIHYSWNGRPSTSVSFEQQTVVLGELAKTTTNDRPSTSMDDKSVDRPLVILEARYGTLERWIDFTERANKAAESGRLLAFVDNQLVGKDPAPYESKQARMRFRMNGRIYEQTYLESSVIFLESKAETSTSSNGVEILEAFWGLGLLGENTWSNVTDLVKTSMTANQNEIDVASIVRNVPDPIPGSRIFCVRYSDAQSFRTMCLDGNGKLNFGKTAK